MTLHAGTRLGPYEIVGLLGAGGMGEVYRARDTRLGRTVAIKILPPDLAGDARRRRRFEIEARAVSALNHPHICVLHDIGNDAGVQYLVMEYVDGQTLAERLRKGPLPVPQVLEWGSQIASALARAHRKGIVHRDLKPGNVMIAPTGVKLLDFGLAKLKTSASAASSSPASVLTHESSVTDRGVILGTVPYMSPEQIEGKEADPRSDLFSFGAMLYEMVTGRRPFEGAKANVIDAILSSDPPPIGALAPAAPPGLDRLISKCLAKDPDARWQTAADLADEFRWLSSGSAARGAVATTPTTQTASRRRTWWTVAGVLIVVALIAAGLWWTTLDRGGTRLATEVKHTQLTFSGDVLNVALSPDGETFAYVTGERAKDVRVMVRDLAGGQAIEVWRGTNVASLDWMPHGKQLLVAGAQAPTELLEWLVPRMGGAARRIGRRGGVAALSADGSQIVTADAQRLHISSIATDSMRTVEFPAIRLANGVNWKAGDGHILVWGRAPDRTDNLWSVASDGRDVRVIYTAADNDEIVAACASPVSKVVYVQRARQAATDLLRVSLDTRRAPDVLLSGLPACGPSLSISADGRRLLHTREVVSANLWRLSLERAASDPKPITRGTWLLAGPQAAPDESWVIARTGVDIVRIPHNGGEPVGVVRGVYGAFSPDGRRLAVVSDRDGGWKIWVGDADGQQASPVAGTQNPGNGLVDWLPDGRLTWQTTDFHNYRIRDLATGRDELLLKTKPNGFPLFPRFSPNGDKIALYWNRERRGLWIVTWPQRDERFLADDLIPIGWSADGRFIYATAYPARGAEVLSVSVETGGREVVGRFPVGVLDMASCALAVDRRSITCTPIESKTDAWLVEHFDPRVARR